MVVIDAVTVPVVVASSKFALSTLIVPLSTVMFWSVIVSLFAVSSASISAISDDETLIVAPLARVIPVVDPALIESNESILAAKVSAAIVVSLTAIVVMPVSLSNSLLPIAVAKVPRSERLLEVKDVTFVRSTATVVRSFIELRSEADAAASAAAIVIV